MEERMNIHERYQHLEMIRVRRRQEGDYLLGKIVPPKRDPGLASYDMRISKKPARPPCLSP